MPRYITTALAAALLAAGAGCQDFLSGEGVTDDPNNPTVATRDQLLVAVQAAQFGNQMAGVSQYACLVVQHCGGTGNYVETWSKYAISSSSFNADFIQIYVGGGVLDLRKIQASAEADGDAQYTGIAKVWEAITMSFAADNWGDVPYSDAAAGNPTPAFDAQLEVYDALQALLDEAIADLGGAGPGPGAVDFIYGGDVAKWREAAHTLKARLHMHTAEVRGATAYAAAATAAASGISAPANDFRTFHTTSTLERNMWFQFANSTFGQYLKAGAALVDLMEARSDARRLPEYFSDVDAAAAGGQYVGVPVSGTPPGVVSNVTTLTGETRITATYRQPLLTWEENQLILAEAKLQTQGALAAQPHLDAVRAAAGLPAVPATLQSIAEEAYVALFQNIEAWQVWKRTCWPDLEPHPGARTSYIPGRLYYAQAEENANPHTPSAGDQDAAGGVAEGTGSTAWPGRNPNDPPGGTVLDAAACRGS
jgi:hypothetical protein